MIFIIYRIVLYYFMCEKKMLFIVFVHVCIAFVDVYNASLY